MTCTEFEEILSRYLPDELPEECSRHMAACPHCAVLFREQVRADQLLRASFAGQPASRALEARVRKTIGQPWWVRLPHTR